jgi:hypothetical protein
MFEGALPKDPPTTVRGGDSIGPGEGFQLKVHQKHVNFETIEGRSERARQTCMSAVTAHLSL